MNKEEGNVWTIVGAIFTLFIILIIVGFLTKGGVVNEYMGIAFFIFVFFIVIMWIIFKLIFSLKNKKEEDKASSGFDYYLRKINEILISRPDGEPLTWQGGKDSRYESKIIHDINRVPNKFIALVGYLKDSNQAVVVIFNVKEQDIAKFYGDPSPLVLNNPFHEFKPFDTSTRAYTPGINDYYNRKSGVNINVGQNKSDSSSMSNMDDLANL